MPDIHFAIEVSFDERTGEKGVRTTASVKRGDTIATFDAKRTLQEATRESIQVSEAKHADLMGSPLCFMNHSCNPSVFIDAEHGSVIAIRPLILGDDVTFFYPSTEWLMASPFQCKCQSVNCLKLIEGASRLSLEVLSRYDFAPHITRLLARQHYSW